MAKATAIHNIAGRAAAKAVMYFALFFFALVALLPLYYLIITAFKSLEEASTAATMFPQSFELAENVKFVLSYPKYNVARFFANTMLVFLLKTAGTCLTCGLAAYGFAKFDFPYKNVIFMVLMSALMLPGELLGIPIYEFFVNTGLREVAYLPLWLGSWFATDIFIIFLFRQFFSSTPKDLFNAARVDGCGELRLFFKILVPISKPIFVTVTLLYFVGTYNDLYGPALYISDIQNNGLMANSINMFETLYRVGSSDYIVPWNYVAVAAVISMIPVVLIFFILQREFINTFTGVGIKG